MDHESRVKCSPLLLDTELFANISIYALPLPIYWKQWTKRILAVNDGPAMSNHFTCAWTAQQPTNKAKWRIVRWMYAMDDVSCEARVCGNSIGLGSTFTHLLSTGQRWCDAMIENIHSAVTHSRTFYRSFHSGHFACDICYLWFCTRGDVLFTYIWPSGPVSIHQCTECNWTKPHQHPACILHVYAPRMRNTTFNFNGIHFPNIYSCGCDASRSVNCRYCATFELRISITKAHTECRARLNLFYMCFVHAWRLHPASWTHIWSKTVISVRLPSAQCPQGHMTKAAMRFGIK